MNPRARKDELVVEEIGEELLLFDRRNQRAHSLNPSAAAVWRACDGTLDLHAIAERCNQGAEVVELALQQLDHCELLLEHSTGRVAGHERRTVSRRAILRRAALTGTALGVSLPMIRSITAPTAALAVGPSSGGTSSCAGGASHTLYRSAGCSETCQCQSGSCCCLSSGGGGQPPYCAFVSQCYQGFHCLA